MSVLIFILTYSIAGLFVIWGLFCLILGLMFINDRQNFMGITSLILASFCYFAAWILTR